jgi:ribosomal-protein-alanine N-acetyltransferase
MFTNNIISERLILRNMSQDDDKAVWEIWSNSENEKYMSDPVESLEEVTSICKDVINYDTYLVVATLKDTGEVIGTCCFGPTDRSDEWGFGYNIRKEFWGKGFATEIVNAVISHGRSLGVKDFTSDCATENTASAKVMEKCGMKFSHKSSFKQPIANIVYESSVYKLHID